MEVDQFLALPEARRYTPEFMEAQRPLFEAEIRANWPNRSLVRYGTTYWKANTRNQWMGWLACAAAVKRNLKLELK